MSGLMLGVAPMRTPPSGMLAAGIAGSSPPFIADVVVIPLENCPFATRDAIRESLPAFSPRMQ
jgi:hypothetical protein